MAAENPGSQGRFRLPGDGGPRRKRVKQSGVRHSMCAAGLGSLYIRQPAGLLGADRARRRPAPRAAAGQAPGPSRDRRAPGLPGQVRAAELVGNSWMSANYQIDPDKWTYYYLYALERYWSFRESAKASSAEGGTSRGPVPASPATVRRQLGAEGEAAAGRRYRLCHAVPAAVVQEEHRTCLLLQDRGADGRPGLAHRYQPYRTACRPAAARPTVKSPEGLLAALADAGQPGHMPAIQTCGPCPRRARGPDGHTGVRLRGLAEEGPAKARLAVLAALAHREFRQRPVLIQALDDADATIVREACPGLNVVGRGCIP